MKTLLILLALIFPSVSPIDVGLDKCLESNISNHGMMACTYEATEEWDEELNKVYQELMATLDTENKGKLKNVQLKWIAHRDAEFLFLDSIYDRQGTMYVLMNASNKLDIVRRRTLELKQYLRLVKLL